MKAVRTVWLLTGALLMTAPTWVTAEEPPLVNAHRHTLSAAAGLQQEFERLLREQAGPAWIGYAFPCLPGRHRIGAMSSKEDRYVPATFRRVRCRLEGADRGSNFQLNSKDEEIPVSDHLLILFRFADQRVGTIRIFSEDCELDAGGLPVYWLAEVDPKQSIKLLSAFAAPADSQLSSGRAKSDTAAAAIALHNDPAADQVLEHLADSRQPESLRRTTTFWLGNLRGAAGCQVLRRMLEQDPSEKVREHCIFGLHLSTVPDAVNAMIDAARHDRSARVREQALFWLSQNASKKAAEAIANSVENDPETGIKKKAVLALSQLPKDEGVPRLIQVARTHRNKDVRKEAMFWLGQSKDARAVAFFEEVLTK